MKGFSDIFWTLVLLIVVVIFILMGTLISLQIRLPFFSTADPVAYSIEFANIVNKPFMISHVLTHVSFGDRALLEESIEVVATSLPRAQATSLPVDLGNFLEKYDLKGYYISVKREKLNLLKIEKTESKCGNNLEGWCVPGYCGVGRVQIDSGNYRCPIYSFSDAISMEEQCCKEDIPAYEQLPNHRTVQPCGPQQKGVCSEGTRPAWARAYEILKGTYYEYSCEENRIDFGNLPECRNPLNGGETRACCAPKTEEISIQKGIATKAIIPLLYKNLAFGTLEVTVE